MKRKNVLRIDAVEGSSSVCRLHIDMHMPFEDAIRIMRSIAGFQGNAGSLHQASPLPPPPQKPVTEESEPALAIRPGVGRKFHGLKPENEDLSWTWVIPTMDLEEMGAGRIIDLPERSLPGSETYMCSIGNCFVACLILVRGVSGEVLPDTSFHHIADMPSGFWDENVEPSLMGFLREQIIDDGLPGSPGESVLQKICKDLVDEAIGCENPDKKLWIS